MSTSLSTLVYGNAAAEDIPVSVFFIPVEDPGNSGMPFRDGVDRFPEDDGIDAGRKQADVLQIFRELSDLILQLLCGSFGKRTPEGDRIFPELPDPSGDVRIRRGEAAGDVLQE